MNRIILKERGQACNAVGLLIVLLIFAAILPYMPYISVSAASTQTVTETVTRKTEVRQVITYDIWKHINGVWQFGKAPGSDVSGSFTLSYGNKLSDGAKVTSVQGAYDSAYAGVHSANSVPSASVGIKSFNDRNFIYSFSARLNGTPEDIKKSTQAEEVEGYRYYIPCVFEVTYTVTVEKEIPQEEQGGDDGGPIDHDADITGEAHLYVPGTSYEGHSVKADDRSVFTVNNKTYGAARMYDEKLASNSFKSSGAGSSTRRSGDTSAEVSFAQPGRANVLLTVTTKSGQKLNDRKEVDVLRTPSISSSLGGVQKQNRKQVITAEIAVNPAHPLKELWIEIEKKGGAERVHLDYDTSGGKNSLDNSDLIKTRAIADSGSDRLFTRVKLEFLTKNSEETQMTYRIYARDDRGNTDKFEKNFTAAPDKAPTVIIDAEKEQLRDEQSSIAHVYAEDATVYDGDDADRTWYVREHGQTEWQKAGNKISGGSGSSAGAAGTAGGSIYDAAFGTWKAITYEKRGVGKLDIKLEVTEKWIEDTLPEYVSESDRHSGSAEAQVDVINIAPVVSLTSSHMKAANLLFLTEDSVPAAEIRNALLEKGISANTSIERVKSGQELNGTDTADSIFTLSRGYGYGAEDTFLEKDWYLCGKDTLYTADGTWTKNTGTRLHTYGIGAPYMINAYDLASGGSLKWSVSVTNEMLGGSRISDVKGMALDDRSKYLFFRTKDRTVIYDGESGAYTAVVPLSLGDDNYAQNGKIYTVKADGIYAADLRSGSVKKLYSGNMCMKSAYCDSSGSSRRVNGEVHFFAGKGTKITHGILNLMNENFRFDEIHPSQAAYGSTYSIIGIGADGRACIGQDGKSKAYVFDANGAESVCLSGWRTDDGHDVLPAYKSDGTFDYIAVVYNTESRTGTSKNGYKMNYGIYADLYSAYGGTAGGAGGTANIPEKIASYSHVRKVSDSAASGSGTDAAKSMYAVQIGNDVIVNNGEWATSLSDGSPLNGYYYTSFSQIVFDTESKTADRYLNGMRKYDALNAGGVLCEYGKITDDYVVSAYSQDTAGAEYGTDINMQALKVARLPKTEDDELSIYINKFAPKKSAGGLDIAVTVVDGKFKEEADSAGENGIAVINYETFDGEKYGKLKSSLSAADNTLMAIEKTAESSYAAEKISGIASVGKRIKITADKPEEGGIVTAAKTYKLRPDTQYYYEFEYAGDMASPITVKSDTVCNVPDNMKTAGSKYSVTAVKSEEFDSAEELSAYFSGIDAARMHGGIYYGAEMLFSKDSGGSNKGIFDGSEIAFEIEDGETAVLQFDYSMETEGDSPDEVYIDINGQRWYRNVNISDMSGTYTHPFILPAGKNTISFGARFYGKRPGNTWIAIDNLKVIFLEESEADSGMRNSAANDHNAGRSDMPAASSQFRKASGMMRTPQQIVSYTGIPMTYIKQKVGEPQQDFIVNTKGQNQNDLEIRLPAGKKTVMTAVTLISSPADKYPLRWDFDGKKFNVNYKKTSNYYASQVAKEFRVSTTKSEGKISISPGSLYKRGAGYGEIEMITADEICAPVSEGRYFAVPNEGETGSGVLYAQNEVFDGNVTVSISGTNEWYMKNFKLYRIEDGRRIYEEDGGFLQTGKSGWKIEGGHAAEETADTSAESQSSAQTLVYKKGETVRYNVMYYDYEADPSKAQYWRYTHIPANDGLHPQAGRILSAPIEQFYVDGKYTVEHWQEDSTGNIAYDKQSNTAEMTFYIESGAGAPWITSIETVPGKVKTGEAFTLKIGVDDLEKDALILRTELYHKNKVIYTHQKANITADKNGRYPYINTDPTTISEAGEYTAVCVVSDGGGTGIREYTFSAEASDGIKGKAEHFPAWENARLEYNRKHPDNPRAANVFWAAEAFKLTAEVRGKPLRVTAELREYPQQKVQLALQSGVASGSGSGSAGKIAVYSGSLFDSAAAADIAKKCAASPGGICTLNFVFTAEYPGGRRLTDTVTVIVDDNGGSGLRIHRVY